MEAAIAPASVAAALTASLFSQPMPDARAPRPPQVQLGDSDTCPHRTQRQYACSVAPSSESSSMPDTPARVTIAAPRASVSPVAHAVAAMTAAPSRPPEVPRTVMPPEVPGATFAPLVMSRGGVALRPPISVDQVSAAAAATAPANATTNAGWSPASNAHPAATPPLAKTCAGRRRPPPGVSREEPARKTSRGTNPRQPVPAHTAVPIARALAVPPGESQGRTEARVRRGAWRRNGGAAMFRALNVTPPTFEDAHSILPLAVLEAMRSLDSPSDEEVAEYVDELLKKRLGLSDTVAAQIGRYGALVRSDMPVRAAELEQILRLVSRRTDAALVFADGGRRAARRAMQRLSPLGQWAARSLPRVLRRRVGFRLARSAAADVFEATFARDGRDGVATLDDGLAVRATPDGAACTFFAAAFAELLRQLVDFEGIMIHSRCRSRGDERCEWRTSPSLERAK